jgi:hypothetical protein
MNLGLTSHLYIRAPFNNMTNIGAPVESLVRISVCVPGPQHKSSGVGVGGDRMGDGCTEGWEAGHVALCFLCSCRFFLSLARDLFMPRLMLHIFFYR